MKTKECTICKLTKDATKDYYVINGYALRYCKSCTNEKHLKRLHKLSVEARLLRSAKSRAQRNNLEFDISIDDIIVPEVCPVLGIELNREVSQRGGQSDSPSIDRIDSSKGYVKGNIWVISLKANRNKGDFTLSQLETLVKLMKEHTNKTEGGRWNPVAKHDHNKGGVHKDRKKDAKKYQSRGKRLTKPLEREIL
jgi:hypothetical protein